MNSDPSFLLGDIKKAPEGAFINESIIDVQSIFDCQY
jgi:hypothetical protein